MVEVDPLSPLLLALLLLGEAPGERGGGWDVTDTLLLPLVVLLLLLLLEVEPPLM